MRALILEVKFIVNYNFQPIKKIDDYHLGGYLVIQSDDGRLGDHSHWLPWFRGIMQKYTQFYPSKLVVGCTGVNSGEVGINRMTVDQLKDLHRSGWEMLSHGRYHHGVGGHTLMENAVQGESEIVAYRVGWAGNNMEYTLSDGVNSEIVKVTGTSAFSGGSGSGIFHLETSITNNYASGSVLQMTDAEATTLLQGCQEDVESWGMPCKHHIYTYHHQNAQSHVWTESFFDSARGNSQTWINPETTNNLFRLSSKLITTNTDPTEIHSLLDQTSQNDGVLILYGHGETDDVMRDLFEDIVDYAITHGVKIVTHDQALKLTGLIN